MKKTLKVIFAVLSIALILSALTVPAFAAKAEEAATATVQAEARSEEEIAADTSKTKMIVAAALVGVVATIGAIAMGWAITGASKGIAKQPEAAGNIRTNVMLGLVFIETAIIYALIVAILVIFVI